MIERTDEDRTDDYSWKATTQQDKESMIETPIELDKIDTRPERSDGVNDVESTSRKGCSKGKFLLDLEISSEAWTHSDEPNHDFSRTECTTWKWRKIAVTDTFGEGRVKIF